MLSYAKSPPPFSKHDTYNIWSGGVDPTTIKSVRMHGGKTYKKRRHNKKSRKLLRKHKSN